MSNAMEIVSQNDESKNPKVETLVEKNQNDKEETNTKEIHRSSNHLETEKDVTGDGGVLKKILKPGSGNETPKSGNEVSVHYVGTLTNGTKFDSSRDRNEPFYFKIGQGEVIKGWEKVVETMKKGEIAKVTIKPEYAYGSAGSPPKIPPNATLVFEIELISWEEEIDLSGDGGVMKKILKEGDDWSTPNYEAKCQVKCSLQGPKGETYETLDSTEITIGNIVITEGLEKAILSMKKGEHALVKVKSNYAYGRAGNEKLKIPADTDVLYDLQLLDFVKGKENWDLNNFEEKYEVAIRRKTEGNNFFNTQFFDLALKKYENALSLFKHSSDEKDHKKEIDSLKIDCYLNKTAVELKLGKLKDAMEHSNKVLEIDGRNVKALWRRGTVNTQNGDWIAAKKDFEKALEIDPDNKAVKNSLLQLKKKITEEDKKDRVRYQNMFQKFAEQESKKATEKKNENEVKTTNQV